MERHAAEGDGQPPTSYKLKVTSKLQVTYKLQVTSYQLQVTAEGDGQPPRPRRDQLADELPDIAEI